jgi:hypothetical protein
MEAFERQECQAAILCEKKQHVIAVCCDHHYELCFTIPSLPFLNICMGHAVILA